jgi:hypothetical protein
MAIVVHQATRSEAVWQVIPPMDTRRTLEVSNIAIASLSKPGLFISEPVRQTRVRVRAQQALDTAHDGQRVRLCFP